jgi:Helix-turn-helix domain
MCINAQIEMCKGNASCTKICIKNNFKFASYTKKCVILHIKNYYMKHEKDRINYHTGEVETVNYNFVQLYEDNLDLIIEIANENPTSIKIFLFILKHMDERNALVISQNALAESLNLHRNTIGNSIAYLKEKKALDVLKSGNTNIYAINSQIAWKSSADNKKYAHFSAKVYITQSEQDNKLLFNTELIGHAKPKKNVKNTIIQKIKDSEETLNKFRKANNVALFVMILVKYSILFII